MHPRSLQANAITALTLTAAAGIVAFATGNYPAAFAILILIAIGGGLATAISRWNRGAQRGTFTPAAQMTHDERVQNRAEFERIIDGAGLR